MMEPDDIIQFWFSASAQFQWFNATDAFDADVRRKFESTAITLAAHQKRRETVHPWEKMGAETHLALIVALDQFPRNMYRNTPAAYAWDVKALSAAKRLVADTSDLKLNQVQRSFAYMPYMHSEDLRDQDEYVRLCEARLDDRETVRFAKMYRDVIARYGRFPHRNAILRRSMTPEEQKFLDNGGISE